MLKKVTKKQYTYDAFISDSLLHNYSNATTGLPSNSQILFKDLLSQETFKVPQFLQSKLRDHKRMSNVLKNVALKPQNDAKRTVSKPSKKENRQQRSKISQLKRKLVYTGALALSIFLILFGLYQIGAPFFPEFLLFYQRSTDNTEGYKYKSDYVLGEIKDKNLNIDEDKLKPIPVDNTLIVPAIQVDAKIYEGENENTLDRGIWRRPNTSIPLEGGNTVLTAHRFMNVTGPNTFYALDKVKEKDEIIVFWEGKEYVYEVYESLIVKPTQVEIEDNTQEDIVTLYTCHPLWTSDERLVVRGELIKSPEQEEQKSETASEVEVQ